MMDETNELNPGVRGRIDSHLDAIDRALIAAGMSRSERRSITDDVEAQVLEMLSSRAGPSPTLADAEAVLAELDSPEAYAREDVVSPSPALMPTPAKPRFSRTAILGAVCVGLYLSVLTFMVPTLFIEAPPASVPRGVETRIMEALGSRPSADVEDRSVAPVFYQEQVQVACGPSIMAFFILTAPFVLGATILGAIAISQIRHSAGRLCGMGLALFDAILFPLLLLDVLIIGLCYSLAESGLGLNLGATIAVSILLCLIVDFLLVRWAWRSVKKPHPASA